MMTDAAFAEATIISLGVLTFLGALLGLIGLLTVLRRRRLEERERHWFAAKPIDVTAPAVLVKSVQTTHFAAVPEIKPPAEKPQPKRDSVPEEYRLPVQDGTPDQVVIMIEPGTEPTRQAQNVRRLIAYLKKETAAKEPAKVG